MQGMARKMIGIPYFVKYGRLLILFYRHNNVVLAGYARLNFASKKTGTRQEGITLNSQIRYAECQEWKAG
jgi:hypothetical protein